MFRTATFSFMSEHTRRQAFHSLFQSDYRTTRLSLAYKQRQEASLPDQLGADRFPISTVPISFVASLCNYIEWWFSISFLGFRSPFCV
jgi:hypothetical protein